MKLLKRNYGHRNLMIFLFLSLVYMQTIHSISYGRSFFSLYALRSFLVDNYFVVALTALCAYMVLKVKKYSEIALLFCLITIVGKNFIFLSSSFNKLTLVLDFIYLVFAFYFFITWDMEVQLAAFNPLFSRHDLEKRARFKLEAKIKIEGNEESDLALITNIDNESCFLLIPAASSLELRPGKKYILEANYEGVQFINNAHLISSYDQGVGFMFEKSPDNRASWSELYKVCLERGLVA